MNTAVCRSIAALLLAGGLAANVPARAGQSGRKAAPTSADVSPFEPLDRWKAAVLAGDRVALADFYSLFPPARTKIPQGETQNPSEEPVFWSSVRAAGLTGLNLKILEIRHPQPGVVSIVLRIEVTLRTSSGGHTGIVSASQVWMQQGGTWRILATQRSDLTASVPMRLPEPAKPNPQLYPPPEAAPAQIASAVAAAQRDRKRVILVFGGNWCYDCHVLDATFHSREFAPLIRDNYHVVHVNVGDLDKNLDLAAKYGIPLKKGVPSLAILDPEGRLVVSQRQGEFESTAQIGPEDVLQFLRRWKPVHEGSKTQ